MEMKTPTLVIHGEKDFRVPVGQGLELYGVLQAKGVPARLLVFPDENTLQRVRHTSPPTNFGGPLQPPMLGAAVASARIHASPEIHELQAELRQLLEHTNHRAVELGLPLLHRETVAPIRFIGLGPAEAATAMATHLLERGLLASCALFPAVPPHQTGIRFTVTRHHQLADIELLLETIADFLPEALARGGVDRAAVDLAFGPNAEPLAATGS